MGATQGLLMVTAKLVGLAVFLERMAVNRAPGSAENRTGYIATFTANVLYCAVIVKQ